MQAFQQHQFQEYDGEVLVIRAQKQPLGIVPDASLGWSRLVRGEIHTAEVPGNQFGLLYEPRVRNLAQIIATHLQRKQN